MKRILLCILVVALQGGHVASQSLPSVTQMECFVDTDPGQGNGTPLSSDDGNLDEVFESATGLLPTGSLSLGTHTLFVRVRNADGAWGAVYQKAIQVLATGAGIVPGQPKLTQAEFFVDSDPGQGNGFALSALDGSIDEMFEVVSASHSSGSYGLGLHTLFIRLRNSDATWGSVYAQPFQVMAAGVSTVLAPPKLSHAEFFVNSDPGVGNGFAMASTDGGLDEYFEEAAGSVNSGSYGLGMHTLSVRFRNSDGTWGSPFQRTIRVTGAGTNLVESPPKIVQGECFVDADPGVGNGIPLAATDGNLDELFEEASAAVSSGALSLGLHTLFVRWRDDAGVWSSVYEKVIEVTTAGAKFVDNGYRLAQAECFVDADPGPGNGFAMSGVDGAIDEYFDDVIAFLPTGSLAFGTHSLSVRLRDDHGNWGTVWTRTIVVTTAGARLVPVDPTIAAAEYFINTDPGAGNGIALTADDGSYGEWYENVSATISTAAMPEGVYGFGIRFRNNDGSWGTTYRSVMEIQNVTAPTAPQNLVSLAGDSSAVLTWNANPEGDVMLYRIYAGTTPNPTVAVDSTVGGVADTSKALTGLVNGTTYYVRITAVDVALLESPFSNEISFTPVNTNPPAPPQNLTALSGNAEVTLSWRRNQEGDFLRYRIYGGTTINPFVQIDSVSDIADTSRVITGLTNGVTHYFRLTAVDVAGHVSAFSNEVAVTPGDVIPPSIPQNLAVMVGDSTLTLSWNANSEADFYQYRIFGGTSPNPTGIVDSNMGRLDTVSVVTGLVNGTTYYFRITAVDNAQNESGYSNEVSASPVNINPPAVPQNLSVMAGDGQVFLSWNTNREGDFLRYRIYGGTSPSPAVVVDSTTGGLSDTSRTLSGLQNGTTYYYRITAVDVGLLESGYSNEVNATPGGDVPPAIPQNLSATAADSQITLTWDANSDPDFLRYRIYAGTAPSPLSVIDSVDGAGNTTKVIDQLANGVSYYFRITAVDLGGLESGFSNEVLEAPININPPAIPILLSAIAGDGHVILTWSSNREGDFLRYRIYGGTTHDPTTVIDSSSADTVAVIAGLTNFVSYYFRVEAMDAGYLSGGFSNELSATPIGSNQNPNDFSLLVPANESLINSVSPTLRWESRGDPDLHVLTYTIDMSTDAGFSTVVRSHTTTDSAWTVSPALGDGLYYWRVTASDGFGGQTVAASRFFRLDASAPDLAGGLLQSPVMTTYLRVYVWSDEFTEPAGAKYVIRNSAGANLDSASLLMETARSAGRLQSDDIRLRHEGNLIVTVSVRDTAGNIGTLVRQYAVVTLNKGTAFSYDDNLVAIRGNERSVQQSGFLLVGRPDMTLAKETGYSDELMRVEILSTAPLKDRLQWTFRYGEPELEYLRRWHTDFDERNIGVYWADDSEFKYLGGEGSGGQVTVGTQRTGTLLVKYNQSHELLPSRVELAQNYPNPFNPTTSIRFGLRDETHVELAVYNILGQEVRRLVTGRRGAGYHTVTWDGRNERGERVASGVYFSRLVSTLGTQTRKMILVK